MFSLALNVGPHSVLYLNYLITKKGGGMSHTSLNIQIPLKNTWATLGPDPPYLQKGYKKAAFALFQKSPVTPSVP